MDNVTKRNELREMIENIDAIMDKRMFHYLTKDFQVMVESCKSHFEALRRTTPLTNNSTGYTPEAIQHMKNRGV